MSYPHEQLILAWLKGEAMQYREGSEWHDMPRVDSVTKLPHWYTTGEYRRKPIVLRYRLAQVGDLVVAVNNIQEHDTVAKYAGFVKWIGDWWEQLA